MVFTPGESSYTENNTRTHSLKSVRQQYANYKVHYNEGYIQRDMRTLREQDSRVAVGFLVVALVVLHVQGHLTNLAVETSFMPVLEKTHATLELQQNEIFTAKYKFGAWVSELSPSHISKTGSLFLFECIWGELWTCHIIDRRCRRWRCN